MAGEIRVPAETWDTMRRNTEAVAKLVVQLQTDIERERGVYMARIAVLEREREELRGELTATTAERDHLRDVAIPEHRERIAELERERDEARAALAAEGELSAERERSHRLVEQLRRDIGDLVEGVVPDEHPYNDGMRDAYACALAHVDALLAECEGGHA